MYGFYVIMRDKFILEKLFPYNSQKEMDEASKEADACLRYNRRCYQGGFALTHVRNEHATDFFLKPYMETLVTQEEIIKRTGDWIPMPTH